MRNRAYINTSNRANENSARKTIKNKCAYMNMRVCTDGNIGYP